MCFREIESKTETMIKEWRRENEMKRKREICRRERE